MDRHNGFVAAQRPESAGSVPGDEGSPDEQRHDAAAALRHLHTKGRNIHMNTYMKYFTLKTGLCKFPLQDTAVHVYCIIGTLLFTSLNCPFNL